MNQSGCLFYRRNGHLLQCPSLLPVCRRVDIAASISHFELGCRAKCGICRGIPTRLTLNWSHPILSIPFFYLMDTWIPRFNVVSYGIMQKFSCRSENDLSIYFPNYSYWPQLTIARFTRFCLAHKKVLTSQLFLI